MAELWGSFYSRARHFKAQLPRVGAAKLARVTPWALVKFLYVALGVDQGITDCTPDVPDLPRRDKAFFYYQAILMGILDRAYRSGVSSGAAVEWTVRRALSGAACYAMGPLLVTEIRRQGEKHSGEYAAALLEMIRRAPHLAPVFGVSEEEVVDRLRRAAYHPTKDWLDRTGLPYSRTEEFLTGLSGQAALTIAHQWKDLDPLELMPLALAGELDNVGQAVARDIADDTRKEGAWRKLILHFAEVENLQGGGRPSGGRHAPPARDHHAEDLMKLKRAASADPILVRYIDAAALGGTRAQIARRLGKSVFAVDKYKRRLKEIAKNLTE